MYYDAVKDIPCSLAELDRHYLAVTGCDLLSLAARAAQIPAAKVLAGIDRFRAAVVPVTSGQGVITGFTAAVESILNHIGISTFITQQSDVAGIGEAFTRKADLFLAADDEKFLGFNLRNRKVIDNAKATATGFVQALAAAAEKKANGLKGENVLVIGLGPVGSHAALELKRLGARVLIFDIDQSKVREFADSTPGVRILPDLCQAADEVRYIFDATPAAQIIDVDMIGPSTVISCPGVPHGLTEAALTKAGQNFLHDVLPLGVASMAVQCVFESGD